jgi:hypothetical protein
MINADYYLVTKKFVTYTETGIGKLIASVFLPYSLLDVNVYTNIDQSYLEAHSIKYTVLAEYLYQPRKKGPEPAKVGYGIDFVLSSVVPYPPTP